MVISEGRIGRIMKRKYLYAFRLGLLSSMEYKVDFLFSLFGAFLPIVIQYFMWKSIFHSSGESVVFGYTFSQMFMYTVISAIISKIISTGIQFEISEDIKSGNLSSFLYRPASYSIYKIASYLGGKVVYLTVSFFVIYIVLYVLNMSPTMNGFMFVMFIAAIIFSFILNFLIYYLISALAFWLEQIWYFYFAMGFLINLLSGGIFPLDIFGDVVSSICSYLPFQYTIFFPVNILNGKYGLSQILSNMCLQIIWIFIVGIFSKLLWTIGMRKYNAVGG